ncbi:MAG: hypothetical protein P8N01_06530 [Burkholderiales bacterium]|nr:hypothetical protein [Burkholderiales bacterium]
MHQFTLNLDSVDWRRVTDPTHHDFKIDFEYSLLGFDLEAGRLDMLLRYAADKGHCRRHRHVASTMTFVLDGEQHLEESQENGVIKRVLRRKGDYALSPADAKPHREHGGESGGTVLLSMLAPDGVLFEYFGPEPDDSWTVSIAEFVRSWESGEIYGLNV